MLACTIGNIDIVKLMMTNEGLDINLTDQAGINAVFVAAYYGHFEIFKFLVQHGAEVKPNAKATTVLHICAKRGFLEMLKYIISSASLPEQDVNAVKTNGMTPALLAA